MNVPTVTQIKEWSDVPAVKTAAEPWLQVRLDRAVTYIEQVTGRIPLTTVPDDLETLAAEAVQLRVEQLVLSGRAGAVSAQVNPGGVISYSVPGYCVPMDTEALTDRGWRSYGDLCIGDRVLGFDRDEGVTRWTPITAIQPPFEHDVVELGNARWKVRCTPEHRWVSRLVRDRDNQPWTLEAAEDLEIGRNFNGARELLTSAPADTEHQLDISPAEAAIVGWTLTDGHVREPQAPATPLVDLTEPRSAVLTTDPDGSRWSECACGKRLAYPGRGQPRRFCDDCLPQRVRDRRRGHRRATIYQSHYREELETALATAGASYSVAERPRAAAYELNRSWLRDVWDRAELERLTPAEFVLRLGAEAREAFLDAGMWAEGHMPAASTQRTALSGYAGRWARWQFAQNRGPVLDAFVLAAHLSGYAVRLWDAVSKCTGFVCGRNRVLTKGLKLRPVGRELVWCVETELGTWTMRQGNIITLTGNSETRRDPSKAVVRGDVLNPWPALADLLWLLMTDERRAAWIAAMGGEDETAIALVPLIGEELE